MSRLNPSQQPSLSFMNRIQRILHNKAVNAGKAIDRASGTHGSKLKPANGITDATAIKVRVDTRASMIAVKRYACPECGSTNRVPNKWECVDCGLSYSHPTVSYELVPGYDTLASEPVIEIDEKTGLPKRAPMDALGRTPVLNGKANGVVATTESYRIWLKAGMPAHPIYNPDAYRVTHYRDNVLLPLGGIAPVVPTARHEQDCQCIICREFTGRIQHTSKPTDMVAVTVKVRQHEALMVPVRVSV